MARYEYPNQDAETRVRWQLLDAIEDGTLSKYERKLLSSVVNALMADDGDAERYGTEALWGSAQRQLDALVALRKSQAQTQDSER